MHHDGVDGILDLVAHAGREPADGRHAPRKLQFRLDLLHRFKIVQRHQRAQTHPCIVVVDEVHRCLDATPRLGADLFLHQRDPGVESLAKRSSQHRGIIEDFARLQTQNVVALDVEKAPRRLRHQHRAPVPGEQQNAVLQISENLVEIFLQRGEDLFHVAHALADLLDLGGDPFRSVEPRLLRLPAGHSPPG